MPMDILMSRLIGSRINSQRTVITILLLSFLCSIGRCASFSRISKVVGGQEAPKHGFPFVVALKVDGYYLCGGAIIEPYSVVTAAHCVDRASTVEVIAGAHNMSNAQELGQERLISTEFYIHENWDSFLRSNDIAVIRLPIALQFNEFIQAIPRATSEPLSGTALGWGYTNPDGVGGFSDTLYYVNNLNVISDVACEIYYGYIDPKVMCVETKGGVGVCNGDSGGPLISISTGELVGISAFLSSNCDSGLPDAFSSIPDFNPWIDRFLVEP